MVNVVKKATSSLTAVPRGGCYIVDTLLHCSPGSSENGSRPKPCPPRPGEKGEMHVVSKTLTVGITFIVCLQIIASLLFNLRL